MSATCEYDWEAEFWGGEPGVIELHQCAEPEDHEGPHICQCRESLAVPATGEADNRD